MVDLDFKCRSIGLGLLRIAKSIQCSWVVTSCLGVCSLTSSSIIASPLFIVLPACIISLLQFYNQDTYQRVIKKGRNKGRNETKLILKNVSVWVSRKINSEWGILYIFENVLVYFSKFIWKSSTYLKASKKDKKGNTWNHRRRKMAWFLSLVSGDV